MPLNLHCRYDREGHGTFSNAILLRQHYDAVHPEYVAPLPVGSTPAHATARGQCSCGAPMQRGSFNKHWRERHKGDPKYVWSLLSAARIVRAPVRHPERERPAEEHTEAVPVAIGVDDIVIPAISVMALPDGMVPVHHLAALFAWRDATAVMLRAVGR